MLHMHVLVQWHDEIDDAHVYEMKCTFVEAKHLGCYSPPPLEKSRPEIWKAYHLV